MVLLAPVLVLIGLCLLPVGTGRSQVSGPAGVLVVGLTGSYLPGFQSISFNVLEVRVNPSTDPNVDQSDGNWTAVPVAPGVGLNSTSISNPFDELATLLGFENGATSTSPASGGTGPSELQVDINQIQSVPLLFNSTQVLANTYHQIEVVLDGSNAGTAVPTCLGSPLEGCIASQISMANPSQYLQTSSLGGVSVPLNGLATLIININPITAGVQSAPAPPFFSGSLYEFTPSITLPPAATNYLGSITGNAFGATQVAAELAGTGQVVETTTTGDSVYQLPLPAGPNGTAYDLVASGPGSAYGFASSVLVTRGQVKTVQLDAAADGQVKLTGKVTDACSGAPLQGATLEILAPAPGSNADCATLPTPAQCVVLAAANTDDTGTYPMPASNFVLQGFNGVPDGDYVMKVSVAGYDTVTSSLSVNGGAACSAGTGGQCNFALGRSQIEGLVTINPPVPGPRSLNVLVTAEDHGTHNIENVTLTTVPPGSTAAPFTMTLPESSNVSSVDMYAAVSDYFNGTPEKSSGHTIAVLSAVPVAPQCAVAATHPILSMNCVGHGAVAGSTSTFDDGTSIVLSKDGVQLMSTPLGAAGSAVAGQFSLCAPADTESYELQRFEASPPAAEPSPAASPTAVLMTPPLQIAQPCASICGTPGGQCLVCVNKQSVVVP